jgi:hypothetical protein
VEYLFLDFEFNRTTEANLNLVCCSVNVDGQDKEFWLHKDERGAYDKLSKFLLSHRDKVFVAYAVEAEARSMLALSLNPLNFKFIDLYLEYRCLTNHNHKLAYGRQLIDGRVKFTKPPKNKWDMSDEDKKKSDMSKPQHNLAAACFKLLKVKIDTDFKDATRDLIISAPDNFSADERYTIIYYCTSDIKYLPQLLERVFEEYQFLLGRDYDRGELLRSMYLRGEYAVRTARMVSTGYPYNKISTRNFANAVPDMLWLVFEEINEMFPEIKPFEKDRTRKYVWKQAKTREALTKCLSTKQLKSWTKTDKKALSLSAGAFEKFFPYRHDYPKEFPAQILRFLHLKQQLNGFLPSNGKKRKTFWSSVGRDDRVRPYFGIYGSQSSRSQPSATGFLFLKSAWMRALCEPKKGKAICGIDFGSQEFLLAALMSRDGNMVKAYESGDPYFYFAKLAGAVPWDAERKDHEAVRDLFKSTTLGVSYGMGKYLLAEKLTVDTGVKTSEDKAERLILNFNRAFPKYAAYKKQFIREYHRRGYAKLPCVSGNTEIPTSNGVKKITNITLKDKIWDGEEWVKHGGVVAKGEKGVIHLNEMCLDVTPDHLILLNGVWMPAVEVAVLEESQHLKLGEFSEVGLLLDQNKNSNPNGLSLAAVYVNLKNSLESIPSNQGRLKLALDVLTPLGHKKPELKSIKDIALYLTTSLFYASGEVLTTMQNLGARVRRTNNGKTMEVGVLNSPSSLYEISWNTLLHWMGVISGATHWTELTTMGITKLETYESLAKQRITKTEEVYDILNCGPRNRFQAEKAIVHNCGWIMWGDNANDKSTNNFPIQGLGASIMRKAVALAQDRGLEVIFTLHDALYIEFDSDDFGAIDSLAECMDEAFKFFFEGKVRDRANIRLEADIWSPDYNGEVQKWETEFGIPVKQQRIYVDGRAKAQYNYFKNFFKSVDLDDEL